MSLRHFLYNIFNLQTPVPAPTIHIYTHFHKDTEKKWRLYRATRRRQRYRIAVLIQGQLISLAEMEAVICFLREG